MKLAYKLVFILFGMSAIFSTNSKHLGISVSLMVSMFNAYETIYFYIYFNNNASFIISNVIANLIFIIFRFRLSKRLNELKRISKFISGYEIVERKVWKWCFYSWVVLNSFYHAMIFIYAVTNIKKQKLFLTHLLGIPENRFVFFNVAAAFYAYHVSILLRFPQTTFAIFFVLVCSHIKYTLNRISKKLFDESHVDYQKLIRSFTFIKMTINFLDDELCFFVLCETIYTASENMTVLSDILHYQPIRGCPSCDGQFSVLRNPFYTFIFFIAMCASACLVSEAYSDLRTRVQTLIVNMDSDATYKQLKFLLCVEKEVHFTMWKIVPINRSFVMCTFGAIFTYVMLLDNMMYNS